MEIWKNVTGFEGLYKVSSQGRIKSLGNGKSTDPRTKTVRILSTRKKRNGYVHVCLCKEGVESHLLVHRLVAFEFCLNPESKSQVNHIDGDKWNNDHKNLEWVTPSENIKKAYDTGLIKKNLGKDCHNTKTVNQYDLDGNFIKKWNGVGEINRELGLSKTIIYECCKGKKIKAHGFKWKYE